MTVFLAVVAFFAAPGFLTTTVPALASLESLVVLALPLPTFGAAAGAAVLFPRPAPTAAVEADSVGFRAPVVREDLALSTMFVRIPAAPPAGTGAAGFSGDTGRAKYDFPGEAG